MFRLYLTFRLRSCLRMLKEIGLLRSMILILITALGIITLIKAEIRWILPIIAILLLGVYHNNRKDKVFLRSQIKKPHQVLSERIFITKHPVHYNRTY